MNINVTARDGQLPESVAETIRGKVAKLPRFLDRATRIDVVVQLKNEDEPKVECRVSAEHANDFYAADSGSNVIAALDSVIDKMERQLRRHKEKTTDHRGARKTHHEDE